MKVFLANSVYINDRKIEVKEINQDIDYLQRAINGDSSAFEWIVNFYKNKVFRICYSYTNNEHDAEDVAQEVFIEIYKSMASFNQKSQISTWIYRIASSKSIDHIRKNKRKKRDQSVLSYLDDDQSYMELESDGSASDAIANNQRKDFLYQGLSQLADRQKQAFVLSQIEGMTHKEIAEIMETTVKSVEVLIVRGKKKLKKVLEKQIKNYL